jgi:hypothetical protein
MFSRYKFMAIERERTIAVWEGGRRRMPDLKELDQGRAMRGLAVILGCIAFWLVLGWLFERLF